jgi:hypothetical protein
MNISKYRRYLVNFQNQPEQWEIVSQTVPRSLIQQWETLDAELVGRRQRVMNHPLVNECVAFWLDSSTLCLGYRLIGNPNIFRPIFQTGRQRKIDLFLGNIGHIVEKRNKTRAYVELFKIKMFPKVLVKKIINFAY